ncbi:MAG TPA: adenosylcobinamide-phosphate synthase CbiB, partial [Chloroflexota bacterium]|nr:adenosylcobinamide-phosphate synthase CbiB [Chloroflexota bacterium]
MPSALRALLALAVAVGLDLRWGEPPARLHPVVWMGRLIAFLERGAPRGEAGRLCYGAGMVVAAVLGVSLPALLLEALLRRLGLLGAVLLGLSLKPCFAIRELLQATRRVAAALERDDLVATRQGLRSLVSRDTSALPPPLLAAAAIESLTENSSDSVVAPLFYFALWGFPGAVAYRMINTLDAMVGYRDERYEHLGKAAAWLDDAANLIPSRLTALALTLAAPLVGGSPGATWRILRRDRRLTASPNAGWPMAAGAGALGLTLEKVGHYRLNPTGRPPGTADVGR